MTNVLGLLSNEEIYKFQAQSLHCKKRKNREKLICEKAKPLFYFKVFRNKDKSIQIHCLLSDATVLVFNRHNRKMITIIITKLTTLEKYLKVVENCIEEMDLINLIKCAKLNQKSGACKVDNIETDIDYEDYLERKNRILN